MVKEIIIVICTLIMLSGPALAAGRPAGCPHAWCGCYLRMIFGIKDAALNLASNWLHVGRPASPGCVGCVAVMNHHVGKVVGWDANGNPIIHSGNHGNRISTNPYPKRRILAYREL